MTDATTPPGRRVALVADARHYAGPDLARLLARRGHDLVLGAPRSELIAEVTAAGAAVEAVDVRPELADPAVAPALVGAGLARFGRLDTAVAFTGQIVTGSFADATLDDLRTALTGCLEAPFHFLKAVVPPMVEQGGGQVLVLTSAAGARPTPNAPLYSSARAGANMLVRNVAAEVARHGVQVNAVGTNFMDFPEFRRASGADDPAVRARIEAAVPLRRLGTLEELAHFCMVFCDGTSRFTTGQFVPYAGGWA